MKRIVGTPLRVHFEDGRPIPVLVRTSRALSRIPTGCRKAIPPAQLIFQYRKDTAITRIASTDITDKVAALKYLIAKYRSY